MYDIIIVGAGPAGLTAALYALRADKKVLILEKENFGGQITFSPKIENFPTIMQISGSEFAQKMLDQVIAHGADIELAEAVKIINEPGKKTVICDNDSFFESGAVILATGSKHRQLDLENEDRLIGEGVSYCAVCDGAFYRGQNVAVVGGGNTALQEAIMLSDICNHVTVIQNLSCLTGEGRLIGSIKEKGNIDILTDSIVTELIGTKKLTEIKILNTRTHAEQEFPIDGLFVAIGQKPENENFAGLVHLNNAGYIIAGEDCKTTADGIFVAGDCRTKEIRQVATASADGAVAALAACRYLEKN